MSPFLISVKPHSTALSPDRETVYAFDLEGRPLSWYERDRVYKRSLASEVWGRERIEGRRRYWRVPEAEARERFARILDAVRCAPESRLDPLARERIERIAAWTPERLLAERETFDAAYRPVTILPPDQYLAIVLQATHGCTWNRCTFCSFYQDRPFSARTDEAFREHCARVGALLGRAADLRRRLFLADGNSLTLSTRRLTSLIAIARAAFPERLVYGFIDVFTGERKTLEDWRELREAGLRRVYVGLESGDDGLVAWLNKPGTADDAAELVGALAGAGLRVSLILMVGAGGERFAAGHVRRSLELVARLPLDPRDVVYLSPFQEHPDSEYTRRAAAEGLRALDPAEVDAQYAELRDGIRRLHPAVRVSRYDIREFIY